jgi:hypothetical protein
MLLLHGLTEDKCAYLFYHTYNYHLPLLTSSDVLGWAGLQNLSQAESGLARPRRWAWTWLGPASKPEPRAVRATLLA